MIARVFSFEQDFESMVRYKESEEKYDHYAGGPDDLT